MTNLTKTTLVVALVTFAACDYRSPTAPTDAAPAEAVVSQLIIKIVGPDGWWNDRLYASITAHDPTGAETSVIVYCDSSQGVIEPASFLTMTRYGNMVRGVQPGAVLTCRYRNVAASYVISAGDWRILPGGIQPPQLPLPPVVVPVVPPVVVPPVGSGS